MTVIDGSDVVPSRIKVDLELELESKKIERKSIEGMVTFEKILEMRRELE